MPSEVMAKKKSEGNGQDLHPDDRSASNYWMHVRCGVFFVFNFFFKSTGG